eukprot:9627007-Alexandrium_andersonii.AAC.1
MLCGERTQGRRGRPGGWPLTASCSRGLGRLCSGARSAGRDGGPRGGWPALPTLTFTGTGRTLRRGHFSPSLVPGPV